MDAIIGFIKGLWNFFWVVIGLALIALYVYGWIEEKREERYYSELSSTSGEMLEAYRERGLVESETVLQSRYFQLCQELVREVRESSVEDVCDATASLLVRRGVETGMSIDDVIDLNIRLCEFEVEHGDEDPESCVDVRDYYSETIIRETLAAALCDMDRAWVIFKDDYGMLTRRGKHVYEYHSEHVDCDTGEFDSLAHVGLFNEVNYDEEDEPEFVINELIYEALENDDLDAFTALLEKHPFGQSPWQDEEIFYAALVEESPGFIDEVLKRNGGVLEGFEDYYGQPLASLIDNDADQALILRLLEMGADPHWPGDYGQTPVTIAAGQGMKDVVARLLEKGADPDGIKGSDNLDFAEPLRFAALGGHQDIVRLLLDAGAKVVPDDPSRYPEWSADSMLESAAYGGDIGIVRSFVERGAVGKGGWSLARRAVEGGNPEVLAYLYDLGLPMQPESDDAVLNLLNRLLRDNGSEDSFAVADKMFLTMLGNGVRLAPHRRGKPVGPEIVRQHLPGLARAPEDEKPVEIRAQRMAFIFHLIEAALANGGGIDEIGGKGRTMLMEAAYAGNAQAVGWLLEHGASTAIRNEDGTALEIAVARGRSQPNWMTDYQRSKYAEVIVLLGGDASMLVAQDAVVNEG